MSRVFSATNVHAAGLRPTQHVSLELCPTVSVWTQTDCTIENILLCDVVTGGQVTHTHSMANQFHPSSLEGSRWSPTCDFDAQYFL